MSRGTEKMAEKKEQKSRAWNAIVYPESLPENWREILDDTHMQWAESPLHDKDVNATGEPKKPHYHITVMWDGPTTYNNAKNLFCDTLNGANPQICNSVRGSVRYMAHLDNPEKHRYDEHTIIGHGGIDLEDLLKPTSAYTLATLRKITEYIIVNDITEFVDFSMICLGEHEEWFEVLTTRNTLYIKELIRSNREKRKRNTE